jgi:hypothetical protein
MDWVTFAGSAGVLTAAAFQRRTFGSREMHIGVNALLILWAVATAEWPAFLFQRVTSLTMRIQ